MRTVYVALMGAEGSDGYRPIYKETVNIPDGAGLSVVASLHACQGRISKFAPTKLLIREGNDSRTARAAKAWGYSAAYYADNGYTFWYGDGKPRTEPDPDLAWWLKPKEAEAVRTRYIKSPVEGKPDTAERHEVVRPDGLRYWTEDSDEIRDRCCALLKARCGASEPTVKMVLDINGYSLDTLNDMLYSLTGETEVLEYFEDDLVASGLLRRGEPTGSPEDRRPNMPESEEKKETEGKEDHEDEDK